VINIQEMPTCQPQITQNEAKSAKKNNNVEKGTGGSSCCDRIFKRALGKISISLPTAHQHESATYHWFRKYLEKMAGSKKPISKIHLMEGLACFITSFIGEMLYTDKP